LLCSISSDENALTIAEYIMTLMTEINLSDHYREDLITVLSKLSSHPGNNKSFKLMTRQDIIAFLNRFRKNDASDPLHKWIGTYNIYRMCILRFFKWLYYPDIEPDKRPRPEVIDNIPQLKRKEQSIYKPIVGSSLLLSLSVSSLAIKVYSI
jgi:hypothetical protein